MQAQKKAFTLIELLVVIAIIALLLSVVLPALQKVKGAAKGVVCLAHIKQYALSNHAYSANNDSEMVSTYWISNAEFWDAMGADQDVIDRVLAAFSSGQMSKMVISDDLVCPAANKDNIAVNQAYPFTYAYNNGGRLWNDIEPRKETTVRVPSQKVSFTDSSDFATNGWMPFTNNEVGINHYLHWDVVGDWWGFGGAHNPVSVAGRVYHGVVSYRHSEKANFAMVDGHVESRKKEDVWITNETRIPINGLMAQMWDLFDEQMQSSGGLGGGN